MDRKFCGLYIEYIFEYIMNRLEKEEQIQVFSEESRLVKELIEKEIFQRCFKSLLYCMNVERLEGNLSGDNPEQRYTWFSEADYCITAMNKVFPSMKMQVYEEIEGKCKYILQVISLFKNNQQTICRCFFEKDTEEIVNIINGGDWHNDKCVLIITFVSGNKIVYKPTTGQNMEFLKGVMEFFFEPEYAEQYVSLHEKEGTWVKFVEHVEVYRKSEIEKFYYNYGKVLFISYLLGMNDMHYENLIAHGEYPIITDVETILSSYLFFYTHKFEYDAQYKAVQRLLYGVMATGMIPIFSMTEYFGGDVSCLSNKGIRIAVEKVNNEYRDDMYIYTAPEIITQFSHLPNHQIDPLFYGTHITMGFEDAGDIFQNRKTEIVNYILDNLDKIESRIILNMTKGYSKIVRIKSDPRYRHNPALFGQLLLNLKRSNQFNKSVYEHEVEELCRSNIPSFYWKMDFNYVYGCHLADKRKVLELYEFTKNTLIEILEYQTDPEMLSQQKRLINDSIVSSIALGIEYRDLKCIPTEQLCTEESKEFLRKNIDDNRIEGADGTISWIGLMVNDKEQLEYAILDWSLYSGLVGIGYMYISEYVSNADELSMKLAKQIYYTVTNACDLGTFNEYNISYFCGLTGIYAFLTKIRDYKIVNPSDVDIYIEKLKNLIRSNLAKTNRYDTLSGIHSAVIYLFGRYKTDDFAKEFIPVIAEYFLADFEISVMESNFNYASFAHGYSGIITSIMCMNRIAQNIKFRTIGEKLWEDESKLYTGEFKWKDMRSSNNMYSHFWCHGSCGLMFSRLIWKKYGFLEDGIIDMNNKKLEKFLQQYKTQICSKGFNSQNYSLCHGNFAFIDYILSYAKMFGQDEDIRQYIMQTVERGKEQGYSCIGAPGAINSIGFMVGESGIQYLLNRNNNIELPSVLAIETL